MLRKLVNLIIGVIAILLSLLIFSILKALISSVFLKSIVSIFMVLTLIVLVRFLNLRIHKIKIDYYVKNHTIQSATLGFAFGCSLVILEKGVLFILIPSFVLTDIITPWEIGKYIIRDFLVSTSEEFIFRGFIFISLLSITNNKLLSIITSSVLFSLIHFQNYSLFSEWYIHLGITCMGILLAGTFFISKSLWVPISFHFGFNLSQDIFNQIFKSNQLVSDYTQVIISVILCVGFLIYFIANQQKYSIPDFLNPKTIG